MLSLEHYKVEELELLDVDVCARYCKVLEGMKKRDQVKWREWFEQGCRAGELIVANSLFEDDDASNEVSDFFQAYDDLLKVTRIMGKIQNKDEEFQTLVGLDYEGFNDFIDIMEWLTIQGLEPISKKYPV